MSFPIIIWHKKDGFRRQVNNNSGCITLEGDEYIEWQASYNAICTQLKITREFGEEARKHWKSCEKGWNKTIKQAKGFLKERDEAKEATDRVCKAANIGLADLRKKRNRAIAKRDETIEEKEEWAAAATAQNDKLQECLIELEDTTVLTLNLFKENDKLKKELQETEEEKEEWAAAATAQLIYTEKAEDKQVTLAAENEKLLEQIETLKEDRAVLKYWRRRNIESKSMV